MLLVVVHFSEEEQREGERHLQQAEAQAMKEANDRHASQEELDDIAKRCVCILTDCLSV